MAVQTKFVFSFTAGAVYTALRSLGVDEADDWFPGEDGAIIGSLYKPQGFPRVELPPNCILRATYQLEPPFANAFRFESIYLRLSYGQLGSGPVAVAQAPLLTPVDGGDGDGTVG